MCNFTRNKNGMKKGMGQHLNTIKKINELNLCAIKERLYCPDLNLNIIATFGLPGPVCLFVVSSYFSF